MYIYCIGVGYTEDLRLTTYDLDLRLTMTLNMMMMMMVAVVVVMMMMRASDDSRGSQDAGKGNALTESILPTP